MQSAQSYDSVFRNSFRAARQHVLAPQSGASSASTPVPSPFALTLNAAIRAGSPWQPNLAEVKVRAIATTDMPFLNTLYAAARDAEVAATGWSEADQHDFLMAQFRMQHNYYLEHFADAHFLLLSRGAHPIGRLYWWSEGASASLIDITLLPEECGEGLGTALLTLLMQQADKLGQTITLQIEPLNPALRLYRRFGFDVVTNNNLFLKMERAPKVTHA